MSHNQMQISRGEPLHSGLLRALEVPLGVSQAEKREGCASNRNNNRVKAQISQYCGLLRELQGPGEGT